MVSIEEKYQLFYLTLIFIIIFTIFMSFYSMKSVTGQIGSSENTTVNITIRGYLDNLTVDYFPVNFTVDSGFGPGGIAPGTDDNPKQNQPFLNVSTGGNTNVRWNVSINATNMTDGLGHSIPVNEIKVNYACYTDGSQIENLGLIELSHDPQYLFCDNPGTGNKDLAHNGYILVNFFLDVPAGQYNSTYSGDIWFHAISLEAMNDYNKSTWYGPGNTTATIKTRIDIKWYLTPIYFGIVNPGDQVNATCKPLSLNPGCGWPTNITIGSANNVPVDLYINGTDLRGPETIDSNNITYSNATSESQWPASVHPLNNELPLSSTRGDFADWGNISRGTDVLSYWNMSVPRVFGGDYSGDVVAKAVEVGRNPTNV